MDLQNSPTRIAAVVRGLLIMPAEDIGRAEALAELLSATNSRAVGCWRMDGDQLKLAGFLAVAEMPEIVQREFVAVTKCVSLSQTKFGVVQAVLANGPAINHRPAVSTGAKDSSPGWLERFEAASSLAVPIVVQNRTIGAIAVATVDRIEPGDDVWQFVGEIVRKLSR